MKAPEDKFLRLSILEISEFVRCKPDKFMVETNSKLSIVES